MGTIAEQIFSQKLGRGVHAGEIVLADVDFIMSHDSTTPLAIEAWGEIGKPLFDPDRIVIGGDSHSCSYGALSCFGTGMGSTDLAVSYVTGKNWFLIPHAIRFEIHGKFLQGVHAKDLILYLVGKVGAGGANYKACGIGDPAVENHST